MNFPEGHLLLVGVSRTPLQDIGFFHFEFLLQVCWILWLKVWYLLRAQHRIPLAIFQLKTTKQSKHLLARYYHNEVRSKSSSLINSLYEVSSFVENNFSKSKKRRRITIIVNYDLANNNVLHHVTLSPIASAPFKRKYFPENQDGFLQNWNQEKRNIKSQKTRRNTNFSTVEQFLHF